MFNPGVTVSIYFPINLTVSMSRQLVSAFASRSLSEHLRLSGISVSCRKLGWTFESSRNQPGVI